MEQKEKTVKTGPCFTQLADRVGRGNEKVGEKRRFHDTWDVGGEGTGQGLWGEGGGEGGEKLENKRPDTSRIDSKGKEKRRLWRSGKKRKRPSSEEDNETQKQKYEEGVVGSRSSGEAVKNKITMCPHNLRKSQCCQCEGSNTCDDRQILRLCNQCNGLVICENNHIRSQCKQCDGWRNPRGYRLWCLKLLVNVSLSY